MAYTNLITPLNELKTSKCYLDECYTEAIQLGNQIGYCVYEIYPIISYHLKDDIIPSADRMLKCDKLKNELIELVFKRLAITTFAKIKCIEEFKFTSFLTCKAFNYLKYFNGTFQARGKNLAIYEKKLIDELKLVIMNMASEHLVKDLNNIIFNYIIDENNVILI